MADDDDAYGQVPEQHTYEREPNVVSLDEPWEPPGQGPPPSWPRLLPPGALALAAAAIALVALLGSGLGSSFGYVLKFSVGGSTAVTNAAHTALGIQIVLSVLAAGLGVAAALGARSVEDTPRWTRDLAIAAVIVAIVAAGVHITLLQSLNSQHLPADGTLGNG